MKMTGEASMKITGRAEALLALTLLFPDGAYPGVAVRTAIVGEKLGLLDRVVDESDTATFVSVATCLSLADATDARSAGWIAREILAPRNSYASIKGDLRRSMTRDYLSDGTLSIESLSAALSYSEPSDFYRAFRKWHGTTPRSSPGARPTPQ
ncbi:helix-turn-helix domain-containing protein [Sphingomonas faeni]|uniref:helix-turn-helix domain-containing protein n=1 Tax=Sphingomonas faeni TaxID=185950 RepID=UPI003363CDF3